MTRMQQLIVYLRMFFGNSLHLLGRWVPAAQKWGDEIMTRRLEVEEQNRVEAEEMRERNRVEAEEQRERERVALLERQEMKKYQSSFIEFDKAVDIYIRTRNRFDSRSPLMYRIGVADVTQNIGVRNALHIMQSCFNHRYQNTPLISFLEKSSSIVVHGDDVSVKYQTPFQGSPTHRVFGYFRCGNCRNSWTSAAS